MKINTEGSTPNAETLDLDDVANTRDGGPGDEDAVDDPVVLAAMMASYKNVQDGTPLPKELQESGDADRKKRFAQPDDGDDDGQDDDDGNIGFNPKKTAIADEQADPAAIAAQEQQEEDERVIFGGLTVKQIREKLERTDTLEKSVSTLAGKLGHMQTQIAGGAKPKALTKEDFPSLREEFGDEYAEAAARDFSKIVTEAPTAGLPEEEIERRVNERMGAYNQTMQKTLVKIAHPDVERIWPGGEENAQFLAWANSLPEDKKQAALNSWQAEDLIPIIADYKKATTKATRDVAARGARMQRAVGATNGATASAPASDNIDPVMMGYRSVRPAIRGQMRK